MVNYSGISERIFLSELLLTHKGEDDQDILERLLDHEKPFMGIDEQIFIGKSRGQKYDWSGILAIPGLSGLCHYNGTKPVEIPDSIVF